MTYDRLMLLLRHCSQNARKFQWLFILLCIYAIAPGCSKRSPQRSEVFPVRGQLTIAAQPAEKATLYFHPRTPIDGGSLRPMAIVQSDGSFRPTTYQANDGLPAGEYAVTVSWPVEIVISPAEVVSGDDRLGGRYSRMDSPAARITIQAGDNELQPLDLK